MSSPTEALSAESASVVVDLDARRESHQPSTDVTVTAVLCAYTVDRWSDIDAAVVSLLDQHVSPQQILLVIDHNDLLFERASHHFAPLALRVGADLRVVRSDGPRGLSGARNTGVRLATGDVVAFLDDDAVADPEWIRRIVDHYADPSVVGVGGHAEPVWPQQRPAWMPIEFDWVVGCSYRGQPTDVQPVRNMVGCNMSLRRTAFELVGGFSSAVGRIGKIPLGCEETELCIRIRQADPAAEILFDPAVRVTHRVSDDRTRRRYFFRRCYAEGLSKAVVSELVGSDDALGTERGYVVKTLPGGMLRDLGAAFGRTEPYGGRAASIERAALIGAGLVTTVAGYAVGRIRIALGLHKVDAGEIAVIPGPDTDDLRIGQHG